MLQTSWFTDQKILGPEKMGNGFLLALGVNEKLKKMGVTVIPSWHQSECELCGGEGRGG